MKSERHIICYQTETGMWVAECPSLPAAHCYGNSQEEVYQQMESLVPDTLDLMRRSGQRVVPDMQITVRTVRFKDAGATEARAKTVADSGDASATIVCPTCGGKSVRFDPPISLYKPDLDYHCVCEQCGERFRLPQAWRDGFWQGVNGE